MRARLSAMIVATACVAGGAIVVAGQRRDAGVPTAAPSGTGVLAGTVVTDATTPQPVRRATVRLVDATGMTDRLVGTDDDGEFEFEALPAGSYSVSAAKVGYVTTFYGAKRPGRGPGVPVAVATGQRVPVALKMLPGGVITGAILDPQGRPAEGVTIVAVDARAAGAPPVRAKTDDRGVYRLFGLAPGEYLVSAVPRLGNVTGAQVVTDEQVRWAQAPTAAQPPPSHPMEYAPVYFPGATDARAAARVGVASGEERGSVSFSLQMVPSVTISGTLVDQDGQPVTAATVALYPRKTDQPAPSDAFFSSGAIALPRATVNAPKFSVVGVAPGEYTLVARSGSGTRSSAAALAAVPALWNMTDVSINGQDLTDLVVRLQPGVRVSGSIAFEHASLAPPDDVSLVNLVLGATGSIVGLPAEPRAVVTKAGAFQFLSVVPGAYALQAMAPTTGWFLKSAMVGGRDLADVLLDVKAGEDVTGVTVTFTDRPSEFAGRLIDTNGRPISKYSIVVFSVDKSLWRPNARRIRSTAPATDGSFSVKGLPAGDYAVAAAEDVEPADLADPEFLSALLKAAVRVSIADGERRQQDLRTGG